MIIRFSEQKFRDSGKLRLMFLILSEKDYIYQYKILSERIKCKNYNAKIRKNYIFFLYASNNYKLLLQRKNKMHIDFKI